jgi:CubicO group peptidase (beta-lactamase class C family)
MHQPGTDWAYSVSVDLQGAIVERISGMSLGEFFQSKIFKPLGMVDTSFYVPAEKAERLADVFGYHPVTKNFQALPFAEPAFNILGDISYRKETRGMESGGGGLVSTMTDYARFCQMMLNGGELDGARILSKKSIDLMVKNVLTDSQTINSTGNLNGTTSQRVGFGLNFGIIMGEASETSGYGDGSYFWGGAASTWFWIDPKNDLFFIGMVQQFPKQPPAANADFRKTSQQFVYDALTD